MKLRELVESIEGKEDEVNESTSFFVDDNLIVLIGSVLKVKSNSGDIFVSEGIFFTKNEAGDYEPDFSLTWVWADEKHPENYLYYESDGILVSLHNLFPEEPVYEWEAKVIKE